MTTGRTVEAGIVTHQWRFVKDSPRGRLGESSSPAGTPGVQCGIAGRMDPPLEAENECELVVEPAWPGEEFGACRRLTTKRIR